MKYQTIKFQSLLPYIFMTNLLKILLLRRIFQFQKCDRNFNSHGRIPMKLTTALRPSIWYEIFFGQNRSNCLQLKLNELYPMKLLSTAFKWMRMSNKIAWNIILDKHKIFIAKNLLESTDWLHNSIIHSHYIMIKFCSTVDAKKIVKNCLRNEKCKTVCLWEVSFDTNRHEKHQKYKFFIKSTWYFVWMQKMIFTNFYKYMKLCIQYIERFESSNLNFILIIPWLIEHFRGEISMEIAVSITWILFYF